MCSLGTFLELCWNGERGSQPDLNLKQLHYSKRKPHFDSETGPMQELDVECPGKFDFCIAVFLAL